MTPHRTKQGLTERLKLGEDQYTGPYGLEKTQYIETGSTFRILREEYS